MFMLEIFSSQHKDLIAVMKFIMLLIYINQSHFYKNHKHAKFMLLDYKRVLEQDRTCKVAGEAVQVTNFRIDFHVKHNL